MRTEEKVCEMCGGYLDLEMLLIAKKGLCAKGLRFMGDCRMSDRKYWHPIGTMMIREEEDEKS